MTRLARVVLPGIPHHVTQRGVRSMNIFTCNNDRCYYLEQLATYGKRYGLRFLCWCLMENHVHLIVIPEDEYSLAKGIGGAHKDYTRMFNFRQGAKGYLLQGRFFSTPLGAVHLFRAVQYILRNPVRAGKVDDAFDYHWSSARYHAGLTESDPLIDSEADEFDFVENWKKFLSEDPQETDFIRKRTRTGRPCGDSSFVAEAELICGRTLRKQKSGPKGPRKKKNSQYK